MVRKILEYPNDDLRLVSKDVVSFDEELHVLLDDMLETLVSKKGLGLASIQLGVPLNVLVINYEGVTIEAINPTIISSSGLQYRVEGCFSLPKVNSVVERALNVEVEYTDRNGFTFKAVASGVLATIWQHEIEHLRGGLYIDNLSKSKLKRLKATYKKASKVKK